jgi:HEAT repeat protein
MNMNMNLRSLLAAVTIAAVGVCLPLHAAVLSEEELIAQLSLPDEAKVNSALLKLEKQYPTSPTAIAAEKKLLADPRIKVKRKAARVLGALHAEVSQADIKAICELLKSADSQAVQDGLKALGGLKAQSAVPEILPLLKSPVPNVIRDACRTLTVLGNKSVVPSLEPLLSYPEPKVQKDAADAIAILKLK